MEDTNKWQHCTFSLVLEPPTPNPISVLGVLASPLYESGSQQSRLHERLMEALREDATVRRSRTNTHQISGKVNEG